MKQILVLIGLIIFLQVGIVWAGGIPLITGKSIMSPSMVTSLGGGVKTSIPTSISIKLGVGISYPIPKNWGIIKYEEADETSILGFGIPEAILNQGIRRSWNNQGIRRSWNRR